MSVMLDFYREHAISPVKQDIGDLEAHFQRRAFLYRSLGLAPAFIAGKRVLEVGPGTGENARYTASLRPWRYELVEPNPKERLRALGEGACSWSVRGCALEECHDLGQFDLVLCEGVLGLYGGDAKGFLDRLLSHVAIGGVLVFTTIDPISDCSEVVRRSVAAKLVMPAMSLADKLAILRPVFAPHLATLKGMTRSVDDWILDNILNPASIGPTFSIPEALEQLDGRAEVLGSSPRFLTDWRWYKDAKPGMHQYIEAYWTQAHNLLDYRTVSPPREASRNMALMEDCQQIRDAVARLERGEYVNCPPLDAMLRMLNEQPDWFGRGQQYLSVVRTA